MAVQNSMKNFRKTCCFTRTARACALLDAEYQPFSKCDQVFKTMELVYKKWFGIFSEKKRNFTELFYIELGQKFSLQISGAHLKFGLRLGGIA